MTNKGRRSPSILAATITVNLSFETFPPFTCSCLYDMVQFGSIFQNNAVSSTLNTFCGGNALRIAGTLNFIHSAAIATLTEDASPWKGLNEMACHTFHLSIHELLIFPSIPYILTKSLALVSNIEPLIGKSGLFVQIWANHAANDESTSLNEAFLILFASERTLFSWKSFLILLV